MADLRSRLSPALLQEVRDVWYEHFAPEDSLVFPNQDQMKRWFLGGKSLDEICIHRFAPVLEAIRASGITTGSQLLTAVQPSTPLDWLALLILLDQTSRNCYRGDDAGVVFGFFDPMARDVALAAMARGMPDDVPELRWQFAYRMWFYLPLMHAEDVATHERATREYEGMNADINALLEGDDGSVGTDGEEYRAKAVQVARGDAEAARAFGGMSAGFEKRHFDIVKQFGRYPHRNAAMGRATTEEERKYLDDGGETFSA